MTENGKKETYKKFPFKFSIWMILVFCVLLLLCMGGIALTTWQFIDFLQGDISSIWEWMKYLLMFLVCGLLAVLVAAMLIRSQYVVTEQELIVQFGIIRTHYQLKKIRSARHFLGSGRLALYFDDMKQQYTIIVVKEQWFEPFVKALQERNESIEFDFTSAEEEADWKKK